MDLRARLEKHTLVGIAVEDHDRRLIGIGDCRQLPQLHAHGSLVDDGARLLQSYAVRLGYNAPEVLQRVGAQLVARLQSEDSIESTNYSLYARRPTTGPWIQSCIYTRG